MPAEVTCPACDARLLLPEQLVGQSVKCARCGTAFDSSVQSVQPPRLVVINANVDPETDITLLTSTTETAIATEAASQAGPLADQAIPNGEDPPRAGVPMAWTMLLGGGGFLMALLFLSVGGLELGWHAVIFVSTGVFVGLLVDGVAALSYSVAKGRRAKMLSSVIGFCCFGLFFGLSCGYCGKGYFSATDGVAGAVFWGVVGALYGFRRMKAPGEREARDRVKPILPK